MFAAAEGTDRAVQLGSMLYSYFDNTISGVEDLTKKGKDAEAVQVFNSLVPNRKIVVIFDKELFRYCGTRFQDGDYQIVIHPEQLWVASNSINEYLTRVIDMGEQLGPTPGYYEASGGSTVRQQNNGRARVSYP
jgi:hypothetical protein